MKTRLTKVGKIFLGLIFLFYLASITSQSGLLLLFIGLIGGCFAVNWTFARRNVRNLEVIAPALVQLVEGESARDPWTIRNTSTKHAESIKISHATGTVFKFPLVKAKETLRAVPKLAYQKRGVYSNAAITISSGAPYGLLQTTRQLQLAGELLVLPAVYETMAPSSGGFDLISGGKHRGSRRVGHGSHFAGVRNWQADDSIKQVHWNSTARRGQLMVKTFEEELGGRLSIVLHCSRADEKTVDDAVRAAASLGVAALQEGHQLEFHDSFPEILRLAPFSDEGELLARLARYVPNESAPPGIDELWRKSTIALVGTRWNDQWAQMLEHTRTLNRKIFFYLPEGQHVPVEVDAEIIRFRESSMSLPETLTA